MAVIKSKRQENPLQVLGLALGLAVHTLTICKNEKLFPKRDRWMLTAEIVRTALGVYIRIRKANRVRVEEMADYTKRMALQGEALDMIDTLLGLIDIAGALCKLPGSKQEYWTGLAVELENKVRAWHRGDKARLKPGAIILEADGLAVDTDTLEHILAQIGTALARKITSAVHDMGRAL